MIGTAISGSNPLGSVYPSRAAGPSSITLCGPADIKVNNGVPRTAPASPLVRYASPAVGNTLGAETAGSGSGSSRLVMNGMGGGDRDRERERERERDRDRDRERDRERERERELPPPSKMSVPQMVDGP